MALISALVEKLAVGCLATVQVCVGKSLLNIGTEWVRLRLPRKLPAETPVRPPVRVPRVSVPRSVLATVIQRHPLMSHFSYVGCPLLIVASSSSK